MNDRACFLGALSCLLPFALAACGEDGDPDPDVGAAHDATVAPVTADASVRMERSGCKSGTVESCDCPQGGRGERRCSEGAFSPICEGCAPVVGADTTTKCIAGRYVGMLDIPYYAPGPAGFCGLVTVFGGGGRGSMAFTLGASDNAEFASVIGSSSCLEVKVIGQKQDGVPLPEAGVEVLPDGGVARTLSMELSGSVDCRTGKFSGEVKGTYRSVSFCDLGMMENDYFMKGPVTATFDPVKRAFVDGALDLKEPPVLLPLGGEAGGKGSWNAALDRDAGTPAAPPEGCLGGVSFRDDLFP